MESLELGILFILSEKRFSYLLEEQAVRISNFLGENLEDETEYKHFLNEFKDAKGPDFSRLRGYVNILGPNQTDEKQEYCFDSHYYVPLLKEKHPSNRDR